MDMKQEVDRKTACQRIVEILAESGVSCRIHEHEATRTVDDAKVLVGWVGRVRGSRTQVKNAMVVPDARNR